MNFNIYNENCLEGIKKISDNTANLIIADCSLEANSYISESLRILNNKGIIFTTNASPQIKPPVYFNHISRLKSLGTYHIGDLVVYDMKAEVKKEEPNLHGVFSAFTKKENRNSNIMKELVFYGRERRCFHPDFKLGPLGDQQRDPEFFGMIIKATTEENDLVVDLYMGSGSCGIACLKLKRNYIGFEIKKETYDYTVKRIEFVVNKLKELNGDIQ